MFCSKILEKILLNRHLKLRRFALEKSRMWDTPKHGSWLNLVEALFSKMIRTFLRHIRGKSLADLKNRIEKGSAELNAHPVVHRWEKLYFAEQQNKSSIFNETICQVSTGRIA